jgi:outer membrane protein TolC
MNIEGVSKDQYKIYGEINQPLTDMIVLHQQKELIRSSAVVEGQKIDVELYKLRERINTIYFGILLVDEQMHQTELMRKDITNGLSKTESAIANGIALKSTALILKAELLRVDQRIIELKSTRKGLVEMLSIFINKPLNENSRFTIPLTLSNNNTINRPELKLFEVQRNSIAVQNKLINAKSIPRVGLFLQTGYGRPALNQLSNEFDTYYIGGLKLNWNISNYYTIRKEKKIVEFNQTAIDIQKESFLFNTSLSISQQNNEIKKYSELLASDSEIITLRESVKTTASKQLENGTISANDYLNYINAEDQAKQNKLLHQIQLLMAQYNYQLTTGN